MRSPEPVRRRRVWPLLVPVVLVVALALLWTGLWFYAAAAAEGTLAGWVEREARAGRIYDCPQRNIRGFPFRIEVHCAETKVELHDVEPPVALRFAGLSSVWQVYEPTVVTNEFFGPLSIAEPGQPVGLVANWKRGQASVHGTPAAPERIAIVLEQPTVERPGAGGNTAVLNAERIELQGRIADGSVTSNPVVELTLRVASVTAPEVHPITSKPFDGEVVATLKGLADFAPKPWPVRLREVQARGGSIEITNARLQQGEVIAAASGTLRLTERGGLDGQLDTTVVNVEQFLRALNLDQIMAQGKVGSTINALDRLMPGLGNIARQNAAPSIMASLGAIGQRTVLNDKPAVKLPLRFADGAVMLGPFPVGRVPPLF